MVTFRRKRATSAEVIYLIGPAGHPNFGDEFIARTWLRHLATHRPHARVVLDCHTPGQASILLADAFPGVQFVDTVWRLVAGLDAVPERDAAEHVARVIEQPGIAPLLIDGIELLASADSIHLIGGGYLNSLWRQHLSILAAAVAVKHRRGAAVYVTGQGLLPADAGEHVDLLRELLDETTVTDVRDHDSDELLGPSRTATRRSMTGDDAWLGIGGDDVYAPGEPPPERRFVVCVQTHLMDGADGTAVGGSADAVVDVLERQVRGLAQRWGMTAQNTSFVEAMPGDDGVLYQRFARQMPGLELIPFTDVWRNGFPAYADQMWITTRFHAHLLAAARGASGVIITGRSDYYPVKHRSLLEQGSQWHTIDEVGATPPHDGGFPAPVARKLVAGKRALAIALYPQN